MRGNEITLFVGNMSCLCPGGDVVNSSYQCSWQTKRVVVTEQGILFFPHAGKDHPQTQINGRGRINDTLDDQQLQINNPNMKPEEKINIMQERLNSHRSSLLLDYESITSPPLIYHSANQVSVLLVSSESMSVVFKKIGLILTTPFNIGRGIAIVNNETQEINYIMSRTFNDAFRFARAYSISSLFCKYMNFVQEHSLPPSQTIINLLQNCINVITPSLTLYFTYPYSEMEVRIYKFLIEESMLMNSIEVGFDMTDQVLCHNLQKVLTFFKTNQLFKLIIQNKSLSASHLHQLYPLVSFNQYLEEINFSNNLIDDEGMELVSRIFEHCIDITRVNLSYNKIQGKDQHLEVFLMRAVSILTGVKIDLSYNQLKDDSVIIIESRILYEEINPIEKLNVSHNSFTPQGSWRLYMGYVQRRLTQPNFQMTVFPLPMSVELFQNFNEDLINPSKEQRLFFDDAIFNSKQYITHHQNLHIQQYDIQLSNIKRSDLLLNISKKALSHFKDTFNNDTSMVISQWNQTKPPVTTKKMFDQLATFKEMTHELFAKSHNDPCVEDIWQLASKIANFPHRVPLSLVARLQDHIWQKLSEALLIRDHYSISYLAFSARGLQMDTNFFQDRYDHVTNRKNKIKERIMKLLNFEVEEALMNQELDDLLAECHRLDVRGFPLSALIYIKIERDKMIQQFTLEAYDWTLEWKNNPLGDAFAYLDRDQDSLNTILPRQLTQLQINCNLFVHPQKMNYFELCFIRLDRYQVYMNQLMEKDDFKPFSDRAYNRLRFIQHNQYLTYDYLQWRNNKEDLQMNSVRLAVYHMCYSMRFKEIYQAICRLDPSFQDMDYEYGIERIDRRDPTIENFMEVEQRRFLLSYMRIKIKVRIYTKNPELPINLHEYLVNNDIVKYQHLRPPYVQNQRQEEIFTIQNIDDAVYVHAAYEIEKSLRYLYRDLAVLDNQQYETTIAFQSIQHIIDIIQQSPCPCLLADELYLQVFRFQNNSEVQNIQLQGEQQLYKILAVLTLYLPPSTNLHNCMLAWLNQKSLRFQLQKPAKKAIQHLITWQDIRNGSQQYSMPDWVPDIYEIQQRFRCNPNIEISIHTADDVEHRIIVSEFATIGELMEVIYNSSIIGGVQDKYSYWVYRREKKSPISISPTEEIIMHTEIPLLREQGVMESLSKNSLSNPDEGKHFHLRRRIYCAWYTHSTEMIQGQHFDLLFHELVKSYIEKEYLIQSYQNDAIMSIAAILHLIDIKLNSNIKKVSQPLQDQTSNRKDIHEYVPFIRRHLIMRSALSKVTKGIMRNHQNQSIEELKQVFVLIMTLNPACFGSCFRAQVFESFQEAEGTKTESLIIVNNFGISLYEWMGVLQRPYKVYMYEDIIGMSTTANQMRLHVTNVERQYHIILSFEESRALECYTDIISYMVLRTNEFTRPLYAYNEIFLMVYRENIFLNQKPNQNQIILFVLSEMERQQSTSNSATNLYNQVKYVTLQRQQQEQVSHLHQRHIVDEKDAQFLIKKYMALLGEAKKVALNTLNLNNFPFHLDCPFIQHDKLRSTKQIDVAMFFGTDGPKLVSQLYLSSRNQFTKFNIPPDKPDYSALQSEKNVGMPQTNIAIDGKKPNPLMIRKVNDELLKDLQSENQRINPKLQKPVQEIQRMQRYLKAFDQPKSAFEEGFSKFNKSVPPTQPIKASSNVIVKDQQPQNQKQVKPQNDTKVIKVPEEELQSQKIKVEVKQQDAPSPKPSPIIRQIQKISPLDLIDQPNVPPQKIKYVKPPTQTKVDDIVSEPITKQKVLLGTSLSSALSRFPGRQNPPVEAPPEPLIAPQKEEQKSLPNLTQLQPDQFQNPVQSQQDQPNPDTVAPIVKTIKTLKTKKF